MRSPWLAILGLCLLVLSVSARHQDSWALVYRDETAAPSSSSSNTADATSSKPKPAAATTSEVHPKGSADATASPSSNSTSAEASASSSAAATTASLIPSSTPIVNMTNYNLTMNGTMAAPGKLPLPPVITPALSVGGVLLILTGVVYCLIGIKNKWIQIYVSAAYLTSLAILVLIVYIVKPPITNGIQGAYLAAIAVPALLLGGGALIFRDVTEGLGCAIGGFSISMFLLVLKPGGTITSQAGKAIFIGVWTALTFGLSLSRFTRSYGIIASSALGGSTAVVLGIDCFSRAGLKEFWLYIWDLNDDLFPILQDTYPITRGMRVELAGIVVFTFFGVLSQLRIWKVIQARRERKEQEEIEANRERDELEAQIGRNVEAGNDRDRGQWEAIYGDKDKTPADSGVGTEAGSTRKGSYSTDSKYGKHGEVIELDNLDSPRSPTIPEHGDPVIIRVAADETAPARSVTSRAASAKDGADSVHQRTVSETSDAVPKTGVSNADARSEHSAKAILPQKSTSTKAPAPKVIPLPFKIPKGEKDDDDVASNATFNDSEHSFKRYSQRFSGLHLMRKPSNRSKRASMQTTSSVEALVDPDAVSESDRAAGLSSISNSASGKRSLDSSRRSERLSLEGSTKGRVENVPEQDFNFNFAPLTMTALEGDSSASKGKKVEKVEDVSNESDGGQRRAQSVKSASSIKDLKSRLPNDTSKVVMQFRTNEWAKHLTNAEQPEVDRIPEPEAAIEESTPAVNPKALLQTAMTAEPKPAPLPRAAKQASKTPPSPAKPGLPGRIPSFNLNGSPSPVLSPTSSETSLHDNSGVNASRTSLHSHQPNRRGVSGLRSASSPLTATPIDEDAEVDFHAPLPTDTLMSHRSALMQHKAMTGSFQNLPSSHHGSIHSGNTPSPAILSRKTSSNSLTRSLVDSAGSASPVLSAEDDDNMSLSARKAVLQRSSTSTSLRQSQTATPQLMLPTATYTASRNTSTPDGRRSVTDPTVRRVSMMANWHQELATQAQKDRGADVEVNSRRTEMYEERKRELAEAERRKAAEGGWGRDSTRNSKRISRMSNMSGREINDAHREVLRKMQAGANRKLKDQDR